MDIRLQIINIFSGYLGKRKSLFILFFCVVLQSGYAQIPTFPQIIPPSPISAEFNKYLNYKVSPESGIPSISVPLHTIRVGTLEIPIELNYHASGIKYRQTPGEVGLGWSLNPGYRITRTVHGRPDEHHPMPTPLGIMHLPSGNPDRDSALSNFISNGAGTDPDLPASGNYFDGEFDLFTFSTISDNGNFFIKDRTNKEIKLVSETNTKINYVTQVDSGIVYMDVWDANGVYYRMGQSKITNERAYEFQSGPGNMHGRKAPTAWLVTDIEDPNGNFARIEYQEFLVTSYIGNQQSYRLIHGADIMLLGMDFSSIFSTEVAQSDVEHYEVPMVSLITTREGRVFFERNSEGDLQRIQVKNNSNDLLKEINFYRSNPSYFLDSLKIKGTNNSAQKFEFDYYNKNIDPIVGGGFIADYWGYYKWAGVGAANFPDVGTIAYCEFIPIADGPGFNLNPVIYSYASSDKEVSVPPSYFSLSKITYPSGGHTEYFYESNKYYSGAGASPPVKQVGLRINEVKSFDKTSGDSLTYIYKYNESQNVDGAGIIPALTDLAYLKPFKLSNPYLVKVRPHTTFSIYALSQSFYNDTPSGELMQAISLNGAVLYNEVTIYQKGSSGSDFNGKTVYHYTGSANTNIKAYVTAFESSFDFIKSDCGLDDDPNEQFNFMESAPAFYISSYDLSNGVDLDSVSIYRRHNEQYLLVKKERYQYEKMLVSLTKGLKVRRFARIIIPYSKLEDYYTHTQLNSLFDYADYSIDCHTKVIKNKSISEYGSVELKKEYTYFYNDRAQLTKTVELNSEGGKDISIVKYPFDYSVGSAPSNAIAQGIKQLQNSNMVNVPIESYNQKSKLNDTDLRTVSALFTSYKTDAPLPEKVYWLNAQGKIEDFTPAAISAGSSIIDSRYKQELFFISYDAYGNILQQQKKDNILESFIWDYNNHHPIAQVINSGQTDIAYTSFEADSKGNWGFSGIPHNDPTSPTGKKAYMLGSSITRSGLSASKTYIVSYWKKSGSVSVNSTTAVPGRTVGGWTYYQHKVVNPSGGLITVSGSSGVIDELRLYPVNAQMTTFAYAPLVGLTSQCDVNNRILYYEYDELQRLLLIRDQDKNIVKKFAYNYSGQPENVNIYYNATKSGTFYRTGCSGCQVGNPLVYTVPANTYLSTHSQADANDKAEEDVNNNGQAYAQLAGNCVPASAVPVTGTNTSSYNVDVSLQNVCTSATYNFTLTNNTSGPLSGIPQGVYNVYMSYPGSTPLRYKVNDFTIIQASSANFYNVYLNPNSNLVRVTP